MMPNRRRNSPGTITRRAVSLFQYGLRLEREGKTDSDLFKKVDLELSRELELPPWCPSVYEVGIGLDEGDDGIPPNVPRDHRSHWERVRDLRRSLMGAPLPR
jgi:hypothetical protein